MPAPMTPFFPFLPLLNEVGPTLSVCFFLASLGEAPRILVDCFFPCDSVQSVHWHGICTPSVSFSVLVFMPDLFLAIDPQPTRSGLVLLSVLILLTPRAPDRFYGGRSCPQGWWAVSPVARGAAP